MIHSGSIRIDSVRVLAQELVRVEIDLLASKLGLRGIDNPRLSPILQEDGRKELGHAPLGIAGRNQIRLERVVSSGVVSAGRRRIG